MGLADVATDLTASAARQALRPVQALDRAVRPSAQNATLEALDRILESPVTAAAIDRIVASPLIERAVTGLLRGSLVDVVAEAVIRDAVIERVSTEVVRAGVDDDVVREGRQGGERHVVVRLRHADPAGTLAQRLTGSILPVSKAALLLDFHPSLTQMAANRAGRKVGALAFQTKGPAP